MSGSQTCVLVVDDQKPIREILIAYLCAAGYVTSVAEDGVEAWGMLQSDPDGFDVIILDRRMPNMNGMELLTLIKGHPNLKHIPVIIVTSAAGKEDIADGIRAGAYYYLTKPIDGEVLLSIMVSAVDSQRHYKRLRDGVQERTDSFIMMTKGSFRFRTLEEAYNLAISLAAVCPKPQSVVVGLSELMINAVEHGNLGITHSEKAALIARNHWSNEIEERLALPENASKFVTIDFEHVKGRLIFTIKDEGKGFDWRRYKKFNAARLFDSHGRGIALALKISFDLVEYSGKGNQVRAVINLSEKDERPQPTHGLGTSFADEFEHFRIRMEEELGSARAMQEGLLPSKKNMQDVQNQYGVNLSSYFETSSELGGDMWGVTPINEHQFTVYVADFSGHGMTAALNTFRLHSLIRDKSVCGANPAEYLRVLNGPLAEMLPTEQYVTMLYGIIDIVAGSFVYATAGSTLPVFANIDTGEVLIGEGGGLPLGILKDVKYESRHLAFPQNSMLLLYSDALTESILEKGGRVGRDGLIEMVQDAISKKGGKVNVDAILKNFFNVAARPLADDLTMVCCVRKVNVCTLTI